MIKVTRNMLLAVLAVLVIVIMAYWWWATKMTAAIMVTGLVVATNGAVTLTGTTTSKSDPATWSSSRVKIHTKSLGALHSTVTSASVAGGAVTLMTAAGAYTGKSAYVPDKGDHARVWMK
jgi:hypothetical protein